MRVLLCHNYYRTSAPSGEDNVVSIERQLLEDSGLDVIIYQQFNDDIDNSTFRKQLSTALQGAWSHKSYKEISALIKKTKPDIAHFHNTFPQISPSAYAACQDNGVPVVQSLHNFRLICPNALLMRDEQPCELCVGKNLLPSLKHKCYRNSLMATSALVWMLIRNRIFNIYQKKVDVYIALTRFSAKKLIAGGIPANRIVIKPNCLPKGTYDREKIIHGRDGYAIYVGRLTTEKGVKTLIDAWKIYNDFPLKIVGDGKLMGQLRKVVESSSLNIEFLGFRSRDEVMDLIKNATMQIMPSLCYEGFPMALLEAYASGTPVIASKIGSLNELVEDNVTGLKFTPGDSNDLASKIKYLNKSPALLKKMKTGARHEFESKYTAEQNMEKLFEIYNSLISK